MNDDTISRRAAIDRINKQREHLRPDIYEQDYIGDAAYRICAEFIERLPSAQPEVRTQMSSADCISRQAAIDALKNERSDWNCDYNVPVDHCIDAIYSVPSAQPERLTDDDFETIRIHLSAFKERLCNQHRWEEAEEYQRIIERFMRFVSSQSEIVRCKECKHRYIENGVWACPFGLPGGEMFYCAYGAERRTDE